MSIDAHVRLLENITFPATEASVAKARRWLRTFLDGHRRCDDAVWLLSEVLTNCVLHTRSVAVGVVLLVEHNDCVQVEVVDGGSGTLPHACAHSSAEMAASGRGIHLLRALASRWGFMEERPHCVVWFVLDPIVGSEGLHPAGVPADAARVEYDGESRRAGRRVGDIPPIPDRCNALTM